MRDLPILIACRDRLTSLVALVCWLESAGHERIILVDNDSTFEPILDYFRETPHSVIRLGRNIGPRGFWDAGVISGQIRSGRYVVTDPDVVPNPDCPKDAVRLFSELLDRYPDRIKAGFGLRIDDLPARYVHSDAVRQWESQFWLHQLEPDVYDASIDTTFAVYRAEVKSFALSPALRTGGQYVATHTPWYEDLSNPTLEYRYYHERYLAERSRGRGIRTTWNDLRLPHEMKKALGQESPRYASPLSRARRFAQRGFRRNYTGY